MPRPQFRFRQWLGGGFGERRHAALDTNAGGRLVWLGAGMLGVFTGLAAITAKAFWTMQGDARFAATNAFFEHIGLIGGFVLVAMMAKRSRPADAA